MLQKEDQTTRSRPVSLIHHNNDQVNLSFLLIDTVCLVEVRGTNIGSSTIDVNDSLSFTLENGEMIHLVPVGLQSFNPSLKGNTYIHRYFIYSDGLDSLLRYKVTNIRKEMFNEYVDISVSQKAASELMKEDLTVKTELHKRTQKGRIFETTVNTIASHINDSVLFCGEVFITRSYASGPSQAMILDFQSSRSAPKARAIIWKEDQKRFVNLPKAYFTNKRVCIRGFAYLYDGIPYIQITDPSQISIIDSVSYAGTLPTIKADKAF